MEDARSGDRAHRAAGCAAPTSAATAVPHEPAPITATRSLISLSLWRRPWGGAARSPYTVESARQRHCLDADPASPAPSTPRARSRARPRQGVPAGQAAPRGIHERREAGATGSLHGRKGPGGLCPTPGRRGVRRSRGGRMGHGPRRQRHVGARSGAQWRRGGRGGAAGDRRSRVGDRGPRRPSPCPRPRCARSLRRHHPGARPQGRRDQRPPAPGGVRLPLRLRPRFVPRPPRRGSRGSGCRSGCSGYPRWPTTWIGRPMSTSSPA